jgi:glycosyltransferase involved in cell wall biosynthesis
VSSGLVSTVKQLTKYGIDNQVVSFGNTKDELKKISDIASELNSIGVQCTFTVAKFKNDYGLGSIRDLKGNLTSFPMPDLVVLHQIYTFSTLYGYILAKRYGIPYAVYPHGSLTKYHESKSKLKKTLAKFIVISKILREADAIIVTCESERDDLNASLQGKTYQLAYGAEVSQFENEAVRRPPRGSENLHIVFSGRFDKKKNLPLVIKALPYIIENYPALILDVAGSGTANEVRKLQSLVSSLKLEGNVHFHGWIDNSKMRELFAGAKLLVLPSENENFALVVAEALSAGVPCVVSKFVGTADIVAKHHAGEIIQELTPTSVADGILKILQGDETSYRAGAFEAVQNSLDWSKIALRWKELVNSLA